MEVDGFDLDETRISMIAGSLGPGSHQQLLEHWRHPMQLRPKRFSTARLLAFGAAAALFTACAGGGGGDDLPEGPEGVFEPTDTTENGTMQGYMTDDPTSSSATTSARSQATYSGTMTGKADVEVSTNKKTWYTLGSPRDFTVELQTNGVSVAITGSKNVPVGTYRFVRINWNAVEANLSAGSQVEDQTLTSGVSLRLGDATTAVMSQEVDAFDLEAGSSARIVVDLNSETWATTANVSKRQIPKTAFENKAQISLAAGS
jgi:hypothetical protein